jgi:hypothetical protein
MDTIKDIVSVLTRYDVRKISVLTNKDQEHDLVSNRLLDSNCVMESLPDSELRLHQSQHAIGDQEKNHRLESRYVEFYNGLRDMRWSSEEQIAAHFGYALGDKGFRRLKEGLIDRLMNSVLFINLTGKEFTDFHLKVQEMYKLWAVAENLHRRGALTAYFRIGEKALALALETENLPAIIELCRGLKVFYATRPRFRKDFLRLSIIFDHYWPMYLAEVDSQKDYQEFISSLSEKKGYKKEYAVSAAVLYEKYKGVMVENENILFNVYTRLIHLYSQTLKHEWRQGNMIADDAITFLMKSPARNWEYIFMFSNQKAACLLMLGLYDQAREVLERIVDKIPEGKSSWFKNREILAINALYAEKYEEAYEIVSASQSHKQFNVVNEIDQETWRLYHGYLHLLVRSGRLDTAKITGENQKTFRMGKWLNEMPIYIQDKRGGNIPLLILQFHFLILDANSSPAAFDDILNRAEALRKYASRNLDKKSEHFRTDCFISLIQLLVKNWHKPKELDIAAEPILQKMSMVASVIVDNSFETEIVPYERQWKWIRERIGKSGF